MGALRQRAATAAGLAFAMLMGGGVLAASNAKHEVEVKADAQEDSASAQDCRNVPSTPGMMPEWYAQRCVTAAPSKPVVSQSLAPTASRGPILVQGVSTNTVRESSVAGIATLTSFGALVPLSSTDFPADFIRLPSDTQRVYQITSAGAVSRYSTGGVNTVLAPIAPAAGSTWSDAATDPTTGTVYGSAIVGACVSSTLSTLNVLGGTSTPVGPITGGGCIISLAADNAGNLFGIDIVADTLVSINKVTGAGTVVGPIGFNSNFGQGLDCDPASGTCYMFTINVTTANSADLRTVNTATGSTALVAVMGTASPGGGVQVGGAVFETISDSCNVDGDCQDGNLCNGLEVCVANLCGPGTPVDCSDGLFCTADVCTPATGACSHPPNTCTDGDGCTIDTCDEAADVCNHVAPPPLHFCSAGAISIPSSGASTPYPSNIAVAGLGTTASLCQVQLLGLSHTWPGDIDILLVGPAAPSPNAIIMSDVGAGTDAVNANLTLRDSAANPIPNPVVSGTWRPTNNTTGDTFPAPAPAPSGGSTLSGAFTNINPNGNWSLYVVDDTGSDSGTLQQWCVDIVVAGCAIDADCSDGNLCNGVETCVANACVAGTPVNCDDGQFCTIDSCDPPTGNCGHAANPCADTNPCTADSCDEAGDACVHANTCIQICNTGAIAINDSATPPTIATPYPSSLTITGATGVFTLVSVDLLGIGNTFPDDMDILLTAPNTANNAILMSDVGGGGDVVGVNLNLTDGAPAIPDAGPLVSGTFAPTNVIEATPVDAWPAPAPAPSGGSLLSTFNGTDPNGNWNLYVVDDANIDSGTIAGGWCLNYKLGCASALDCDDADPCTADACVNSSCTHTGILTPGVVTDVSASSDKQTYSWVAEPNSTNYDVVRGDLNALPVGPGGGDEICFDNLLVSVVVDPSTPAPGGPGYWYIVRGENACANGSYGSGSAGPRITTTCP